MKISEIGENCDHFIWCFQNLVEPEKCRRNEIERRIMSDPFYSHKNGYKMCLLLYPDGFCTRKGTFLSLYISVMPGEFDHILQWPFLHEIKLDLLNQKTGLVHISHSVKYNDDPSAHLWSRPIGKRNVGVGVSQFIDLSKLVSNRALYRNNQIKIKVTTKLKH